MEEVESQLTDPSSLLVCEKPTARKLHRDHQPKTRNRSTRNNSSRPTTKRRRRRRRSSRLRAAAAARGEPGVPIATTRRKSSRLRPIGAAIRNSKTQKKELTPQQVWEKTYFGRVNEQLKIVRFHKFTLETYEGEGWRGLNLEKLRPENDLKVARKAIVRAKLRMREVLKDLCEGPDAKREKKLRLKRRRGTSIDAKDIFCAVCVKKHSSDDNDIVLCDLEGCGKAFHQKCIIPHVLDEELGDPWFCRRCLCLLRCLNAINEEFGTEFNSWLDVFPDVQHENEQPVLLPSDTDDDDFILATEDEDDDDDNESTYTEASKDAVILTTKRRRTPVDYRKLAQEMFSSSTSASSSSKLNNKDDDDVYDDRKNKTLIEGATLASLFSSEPTRKRVSRSKRQR